MKVGAPSHIRPVTSATILGAAGGDIGPPGEGAFQFPPGGSVPIASGSNTWAWGSNVQLITSNSSNQLMGPFVNFASGSGIAFAAASNTLTISSTVSSSGGSGTATDVGFNPWKPPASPNAADEEGKAALSGWTNRRSASSDGNVVSDIIRVYKTGAVSTEMTGADKSSTMADGDTWTLGIKDGLLYQDFTACGLYIADSTPANVRAIYLVHDGNNSYPQMGVWTSLTVLSSQTNYQNPGLFSMSTLPIFFRVRRNSSTSFDFQISFNAIVWRTLAAAFNPSFTVDRVGIFAGSLGNTVDTETDADFLRKNWTPGT